jgi:hypothetical protein
MDYHRRPRNRPLVRCARPSACNDRSASHWVRSHYPLVPRYNRSFRRPIETFPPLGRLAPWTNQSLQGPHHKGIPSGHRLRGPKCLCLSPRDARPKPGRRRLGCCSIRAAELQRQRARCYARPGCCWPIPHSYFQYCYFPVTHQLEELL